jgi:L,D-peptidoglycan transpeptidase YkuD (ErfK/YbiS/YcfS/YnhG family)
MNINRRKILVFVLFLLLALVVVTGLLVFLAPKPPGRELQQAREKIAEARALKADIYSPDLFHSSEQLYESAMAAWKKENRKFFSLRNYQQARALAVKAGQTAERAKSDAVSNSLNLNTVLKKRIDALDRAIGHIRDIITILPLPESVCQENSRGILLFNEARAAFDKEQYPSCLKKINEAEQHINRSSEYVINLLTTYFQNHPAWVKLAETAINRSDKEKSCLIIIDKFARTCMVYQSGIMKHSFDVELGKNWIGGKRHMGDKSTPEGYYRIIERLEGRRTKFYKALLIDYPNDDDVQRFNDEKKNGRLSESAEIGGLIEIHGEGGKGTDWTDGCIALRNNDMDILYGLAKTGTSVIIVGSLRPLNEIISISDQ